MMIMSGAIYEEITIRRQPDHGNSEYNVSMATIYSWSAKFGGPDAVMMKPRKKIEAENASLKNVPRRTQENGGHLGKL